MVKQRAELFTTPSAEMMRLCAGKPRKNVCILSTFSGAKAKPESVMYTKYGVDVPDQMARLYSVKGGKIASGGLL